jgi:hypothetical protein
MFFFIEYNTNLYIKSYLILHNYDLIFFCFLKILFILLNERACTINKNWFLKILCKNFLFSMVIYAIM